jgi:predicted dehydrogenase
VAWGDRSGYDYDGGVAGSTHASSYRHHPGFELVAGIDPDPEQRNRFERKYAKPAFPGLSDLPAEVRADVYSICVPTPEHSAAFSAVLERGARAIVCEKPIASDVDEACRMVAAARARGCAVAVNYMRRFEPGVQSVRQALSAGRVGEVYKGVVWYGRGLVHNGSHFVDLLRFLLGEASEPRLLSRGRVAGGGDPEPDVMRWRRESLLATRAMLTLSELELVGTRGGWLSRGRAEDRGLETQADPAFPPTRS